MCFRSDASLIDFSCQELPFKVTKIEDECHEFLCMESSPSQFQYPLLFEHATNLSIDAELEGILLFSQPRVWRCMLFSLITSLVSWG